MRPLLRYSKVVGVPAMLIPMPVGFVGEGNYELTIILKSKSNATVRSVRCFLYSDSSEAQRKAADPSLSYLTDMPWLRAGEGFDPKSQKITFFAPFAVSNKRDIFGRFYDERDWQFQGVLIEGTFEIGRRFRVGAEIPSRHLMDKIEVTIP
jgi:hypothetical protein